MFENIENLEIVSSFQGKSKTSKTMITKKTNAFYFRTMGTGAYIINNRAYSTSQNEMLFIPKGTTYSFVCDTDSGFAAYPRYTVPELLQLAGEELGTFRLTEDQKAGYGLE